MTKITVNGRSYSDDGSSSRDMQAGGHTLYLLPMLGDTILELDARLTTFGGGMAYALVGTGNADPGPGKMGFAGASLPATTVLAISTTTADGAAIAALFDAVGSSDNPVKAWIRFGVPGDSSRWAMFQVTLVETPAGGWRRLTGSMLVTVGTPLAVGEDLRLGILPVGRRGETGPQGLAGDLRRPFGISAPALEGQMVMSLIGLRT